MLTEVQEKWVSALESGNYKQCRARLRKRNLDNSEEFCCLGVACEILDIPRTLYNYEGVPTGFECLPDAATKILGLHSQSGILATKTDSHNTLTLMNDDGNSFVEIAAYIRANPEKVFVSDTSKADSV